jgi:4-hydroxymandelate oxidase
VTASVPLHCLEDLRAAAAAALPQDVWDFLSGGSGDELTLDANREALRSRFVVPRVLRDVSACTTNASLLGRPVSMPVGIAPLAFHRLFHEQGEIATARAAKMAGVPFVVSTMSSTAIEDVAATGASVWLQSYWLRDAQRSFDLIARAEAAGCEAIVLTVDMPWMGRRLRDIRNRFALPDTIEAVNLGLGPGSVAHRSHEGSSALAAHTSLAFSAALTWSQVDAIRERTRLPLVLKGILSPDDAAEAAEHGVAAVIVSNHGGRQLDGTVATIDVLAEISQAVAGRCEVLVDGGFRTGTDILKALALGADGVLVGRPAMWGLAVGGTDGVRQMLDLLGTELRDALGLAGCESVRAARALRTFTSRSGADRNPYQNEGSRT